MPQRVLERRALELFGGPFAERAARSGDDHAANVDARTAGDALQDRAVLAVDRNDLSAACDARCRRPDAPGHDERFLIRERYALSARERGERRVEPGRADDRVEHDVDVVALHGVDETLRADAPSARAARFRS